MVFVRSDCQSYLRHLCYLSICNRSLSMVKRELSLKTCVNPISTKNCTVCIFYKINFATSIRTINSTQITIIRETAVSAQEQQMFLRPRTVHWYTLTMHPSIALTTLNCFSFTILLTMEAGINPSILTEWIQNPRFHIENLYSFIIMRRKMVGFFQRGRSRIFFLFNQEMKINGNTNIVANFP